MEKNLLLMRRFVGEVFQHRGGLFYIEEKVIPSVLLCSNCPLNSLKWTGCISHKIFSCYGEYKIKRFNASFL